MKRYRIIPNIDWRGDRYFNVYDMERRITLGRRFYAMVHAQDYMESLERRQNMVKTRNRRDSIMVKTTRAQREALFRKWQQCPSPLPRTHEQHSALSYRQFRKTVIPGDYGSILVQWCGMWVGIEADGYAHT